MKAADADVWPVPPFAIGRVPVTSEERLVLPVVRPVPFERTGPDAGTVATVPEAGNVAVELIPVPPRVLSS